MSLDSQQIIVCCALGVVTIVLIGISMVLAGQEAAVARVTRTSLNNHSLEIQTDEDLTDFERRRKLKRLARVRQLVVDRNATGASAAFCHVLLNVLVGVLVSVIASQCVDDWWIDLLVGLGFACIIGFMSVVARPRMTGIAKPLDLLLRHSVLLSVVVALTPFVRIPGFRRIFRQEGDGNLSDDEEIEKIRLEQSKEMIDRLAGANDVKPEIAEMLRNVLTLSDTLTREIMVPRTDMLCVDKNTTLEETLKLFSRSGFSRIPVIGEDVDDLIGMAYLKDAVQATAYNPQALSRTVRTIARDPLLVPESKLVDDLFHQMQSERQHIAIVVDEYGGIAGLVTIEDALEQIVGELEDEHDRTQHVEPVQLDGNRWKMPARAPIADVEEIFEIDIDEDEVDTVYGLLTKLLGRVPTVGESACTHGLRFTAVDSAGRRKKVSMIVVEPEKAQDESEEQM